MIIDARFPKSKRLLTAAHYRAVFDQADWKVSTKEILCLSRDNGLDHSRLGLVIAKKNIRQSVQRNRVKRIIRESFRTHHHEIPNIDMVILARKGLDNLSNEDIHSQLNGLWKRLDKKVKKANS